MVHFDPRAIEKCHDRMDKARQALFECRGAQSYKSFNSAWASFLVHTGSVIHALESGADITPQGKQWYGGIRRLMRADPLVRYMYQARSAEEHQNDPVGGNAPVPGAGLVNPVTNQLEPMEDPNDAFKPENAGKTIGFGFHGAGPFLRTVTDNRYKGAFPPPDSHKGKALHSRAPVIVAELYLRYLSEVVSKAEEMAA